MRPRGRDEAGEEGRRENSRWQKGRRLAYWGNEKGQCAWECSEKERESGKGKGERRWKRRWESCLVSQAEMKCLDLTVCTREVMHVSF